MARQTNKPTRSGRREWLRRSLLGLAGLAGSSGLARMAAAASDLPRLSEDDPTARSLQYVHDASESEARQNNSHFCHNCRYYKAGADEPWGPCELFPGKAVAGEGWCNVWAAKN